MSRVIAVPVANGVAEIPRQPRPYRLIALAGTIVLDNINVAATPAAGEVTRGAPNSSILQFVLTGPDAGTITFAFANVDPGGGVIWVDDTLFVTAQDYLDGLVNAVGSTTELTASEVGGVVTVTTTSTGAAVTIVINAFANWGAGSTLNGADAIVPTPADTLTAFVEIVHGLVARLCEIVTDPIQSPQVAPANVVVTFALGLFQISVEVEDNEWSATQSMIRNLEITSEDVVTMQPVVRGAATVSAFTNVVAVVEDIEA